MPPSPAVTTSRPSRRAAEVLAGALGEGLVGALQNALRADVDPRAGGHLPVHRQAERLEPAELVPGRPARHEVRVGDEHARRFLVGAEDADRLPALHEQRLVVREPPQRVDDAMVGRPVAGRLARAAVDDEVARAARRRPGRGCSSASAGRLPDASRWQEIAPPRGAAIGPMSVGVVAMTVSTAAANRRILRGASPAVRGAGYTADLHPPTRLTAAGKGPQSARDAGHRIEPMTLRVRDRLERSGRATAARHGSRLRH